MSNSSSSIGRRKRGENQAEVLNAPIMPESFAWSEFLPPEDRRAFLDQFSRTLIASAELDSSAQVVREWRATAEIYAQPGLAKRLKQLVKLTDGRSIPAPNKASSTSP
jgi:hypothetical protein